MVAPAILLALRLLLSLVFASSTITKAASTEAFAQTLDQLGVPARFRWFVVWAVIGYEGSLVVLFATGLAAVVTAMACVALLSVFAAVALVVHRSGREVRCNCFGPTTTGYLGHSTAARAGLLALAAIAYAWLATLRVSPSRDLVTTAVVSGIAAIALLLIAEWTLALPTLLRIWRDRRRAAISERTPVSS